LRSLDRDGSPQTIVAWGPFRIPKGLKCVERREAGRGAGVHAPQAEFTFRDVLSLALIGNASGRTVRVWEKVDPGVFDKETRRKPLAFAADAVRYGI
jgi:hypothetical protein